MKGKGQLYYAVYFRRMNGENFFEMHVSGDFWEVSNREAMSKRIYAESPAAGEILKEWRNEVYAYGMIPVHGGDMPISIY
jgi:hypothetical protein